MTVAPEPAHVDIETDLTTSTAGVRAHIAVTGEIDAHTSDEVDAAVDDALEQSDDVVIDLSGVTFIDSAGLRSLIRAHRRLQEVGGLALRNVPPGTRRIFEVTGLLDQFRFV